MMIAGLCMSLFSQGQRQDLQLKAETLLAQEASRNSKNNNPPSWAAHGSGPQGLSKGFLPQIDSFVYEKLDTNAGRWVNVDKTEFIIDADGNLKEELLYLGNKNSSSSSLNYKYVYSYDSRGNLTKLHSYGWFGDSEKWKDWDKEEYKYDSKSRMTEEQHVNWSFKLEKWVNFVKFEYSYSSSDQLLEKIELDWDDDLGKWSPRYKETFSYGPSGSLDNSSVYDWDKNQYTIDDKYAYTYSSKGTLLTKIQTSFNEDKKSWIVVWTEENSIDKDGYVTSFLRREYNRVLDKLVERDRVDYTYDDNGNPKTESSTLIFNSSSDSAYSKFVYFYDTAYTQSEFSLPRLDYWAPEREEKIVNMPLGCARYRREGEKNKFRIAYRTTYFYSSKLVSAESFEKVNVGVYPNPFNEQISFVLDGIDEPFNFQLFDVSGCLVANQEVNDGHFMTVPNLKSGVYFYVLSSRETQNRGKLIKE